MGGYESGLCPRCAPGVLDDEGAKLELWGISLSLLARPKRFELLTPRFVV